MNKRSSKVINNYLFYIFLCGWCLCPSVVLAQALDSVQVVRTPAPRHDTIVEMGHSPRVAVVRSAVLPGLGQIYNKKYWKVPFIYAALGAAGYMVYTNQLPFKDAKDRLFLKNTLAINPTLIYSSQVRATAVLYSNTSLNALRQQREDARRSRDLFVLLTLAAYGFQLVDASVDAHLFDFNINDDISLRLLPQYNIDARSMVVGVQWRW